MKKMIKKYLYRYKKENILLVLSLIIGLIFGIVFFNKRDSNSISEINLYIKELILNLKSGSEINRIVLLLESIKSNCLFILIIWFLGCTVIGSFLVYMAIIYKGFSIGYTIIAIINSIGIKSGLIFIFSSMIIQNTFLIIAIALISNSGIQIYKSIKRNSLNLKVELIRHFVIMLIALAVSIISSIVEVYISINFLILLKDFL